MVPLLMPGEREFQSGGNEILGYLMGIGVVVGVIALIIIAGRMIHANFTGDPWIAARGMSDLPYVMLGGVLLVAAGTIVSALLAGSLHERGETMADITEELDDEQQQHEADEEGRTEEEHCIDVPRDMRDQIGRGARLCPGDDEWDEHAGDVLEENCEDDDCDYPDPERIHAAWEAREESGAQVDPDDCYHVTLDYELSTENGVDSSDMSASGWACPGTEQWDDNHDAFELTGPEDPRCTVGGAANCYEYCSLQDEEYQRTEAEYWGPCIPTTRSGSSSEGTSGHHPDEDEESSVWSEYYCSILYQRNTIADSCAQSEEMEVVSTVDGIIIEIDGEEVGLDQYACRNYPEEMRHRLSQNRGDSDEELADYCAGFGVTID